MGRRKRCATENPVTREVSGRWRLVFGLDVRFGFGRGRAEVGGVRGELRFRRFFVLVVHSLKEFLGARRTIESWIVYIG